MYIKHMVPFGESNTPMNKPILSNSKHWTKISLIKNKIMKIILPQ